MNLSWQQKVIGFIICAIIAAIFIVVVREREMGGKRRTERERLEGKSEREREGEGMEREGEGMKREGKGWRREGKREGELGAFSGGGSSDCNQEN